MFRIDLRSLAAFRIAISLVLLWDLCVRSVDMEAHYSDRGVLPRTVLIENFLANHPYVSLHILHGSVQFQALLFCAAGLFALALLFGYRTRVATVASWFLLCSLHARNPLIVHGGDDLMRVLLFWGMFVPLGAQWSIDRAFATELTPDDQGICSVGSAGLLLQLCFMYMFSGALKSHSSWRTDGSAVYLALSIDQYSTALGRALMPYRDLLRAFTFGTLAIEIGGPFVALFSFESVRLRNLTVAAFIGFHLGLCLCIELGIFPAVCIAGWLTFLPGAVWDKLQLRVGKVVTTWYRRYSGHLKRIISRFCCAPPTAMMDMRPSLLGTWFAVLALVYIVMWNARATDYNRLVRVFPRSLNLIGETLRIDQYWGMFAPFPSAEHGWYVLYARLHNGEEIDLLSEKPVSWTKPRLVSAQFRSERWRKYLMNLAAASYSSYRPYYAQYLHRSWNAGHPEARQLAHLEVCFIEEDALPGYRLSPQRRVSLWIQDWTE